MDDKKLKEYNIELLKLIGRLCQIPSPSNHEEKKAIFIKSWLESQGAEKVHIDSALNVVYPMGCEGKDDLIVFMAHMDTVYHDKDAVTVRDTGNRLYAPGIVDDTANLAVMLMSIRYLLDKKYTPTRGILFVANAGEEGLANLKGVRQIMEDYKGRISRVYDFDGMYDSIVDCPVGSHRYRVSIDTEGGHSYTRFGNRNAIVLLADLIHRLYQIQVPENGDSHTTYNVGTIEGGDSVNTIPGHASMLYEYRSDDEACLHYMRAAFRKEVDALKQKGIDIKAEVVGERPCMGNVDRAEQSRMTEECRRICEKYTGIICSPGKGSTDSNIPLSLGIPAVCIGTCMGGGVHTVGEWVEKKSLKAGLKIALELILTYFAEA